MKARILVLFLATALFASCKKNDVQPVNPIIGTWNSLDPPMQFIINNVDGTGDGRFTFTEVTTVPEFYLVVKAKDGSTIKYGIYQPDINNLYLTDQSGLQVHFSRSK